MTEKIFICHRCSESKKVPQECPNCHSYKLKSVGFAGSQKIEEKLGKFLEYSDQKIETFILDSTTIKTAKDEQEIIEKINESESCICIATQMIFSHRYMQKFDLIGVISADSLISMPDFRSEEQLFYQFRKLLDFNSTQIIIQTHNIENPILQFLTQDNYGDFYDQDLQVRKMLYYPPFSRLVKLSFKYHDKSKAEYEARILNEKLKMTIAQRRLDEEIKILGPSPAFIEKERGLYVYNIILKIPPEQRPDAILRFVPSHWYIDVDPKSIL